MTASPPVFDEIFDVTDPAEVVRLRRMVEELKVTVQQTARSTGILLHKWLSSSRLHLVIHDSTLEGRKAAEILLAQGYELGVSPIKPQSALSDIVERVKQKTAHLDPPSKA